MHVNQILPECHMPSHKRSLVLIAGWGADHSTWSELLNYFADDFELCFIDLHDSYCEGQTLQEFISSIVSRIPEQSLVIAWSLGGMLAANIAAHYPAKVSSLITLACNVSFVVSESWPTAMSIEVFNQFLQDYSCQPDKTVRRFNALQVQGDQAAKKVLKTLHLRSVLVKENANHVVAYRLLEFLSELDASCVFTLKQPYLNVFGAGDALVPKSAALAFEPQSTINTTTRIIENAGHAFHISHADLLAREVYRFLGRTEPRYRKNKRRIADSFSKASNHYDDFAALQHRVANKLCRWASDISGRVLDLGCGTGYCSEAIAQRDNVDSICAFDIARHMLLTAREKIKHKQIKNNLVYFWCNGDAENLPFKAASFDWIVSSLVVQWCDELQACFDEAARCLEKNGRFLLSSLGPETLKELNSAWQVADPVHVHINTFLDAELVMALAKHAGFEVELFAQDYEVLSYQKVTQLMRELKGIGAHNVNQGENPGLTGKAKINALTQAYDTFRLSSGDLPATYQVYYWQFLKK